jgi:mannose/fructose-specific phosphotransferase system component IIA
MNEPGLRGVIIGHGELADGLASAVRRITGLQPDVLIPLSNEGLGPDGIRERLDEILAGGPGVIFADLREGSCGIGGRKVCLGRGDRLLVTGVNLAVLLEFVTHRELSLEELAVRLVDRGRTAIISFPESI